MILEPSRENSNNTQVWQDYVTYYYDHQTFQMRELVPLYLTKMSQNISVQNYSLELTTLNACCCHLSLYIFFILLSIKKLSLRLQWYFFPLISMPENIFKYTYRFCHSSLFTYTSVYLWKQCNALKIEDINLVQWCLGRF